MPEIKDNGKVWLRGQVGTAFAVKVDETVYVPGQEDGQSCDYWLDGEFLCVDLHDPEKEVRIARRFPLTMEPSHPATLFNGFTRTKHADVKVATFEDERVKSRVFQDEDYRKEAIRDMSRDAFWQRSGLDR